MSTSKKSFFTGGTVVVPVGATIDYYCTGQLFICKESSDTFQMSFNDGEFFPMEVGLGFRLNPGDEFTRLSFTNATQNIITITFYVGSGQIQDARLNTMIDRLIVASWKDFPDYVASPSNGRNTLSTQGGGTTYAGTDGSGRQRKQITIQNVDAANYIWITDASGNAVAQLAPGQAWTMASSGTYKVYAVTSQASYLVCQTFYTS